MNGKVNCDTKWEGAAQCGEPGVCVNRERGRERERTGRSEVRTDELDVRRESSVLRRGASAHFDSDSVHGVQYGAARAVQRLQTLVGSSG